MYLSTMCQHLCSLRKTWITILASTSRQLLSQSLNILLTVIVVDFSLFVAFGMGLIHHHLLI